MRLSPHFALREFTRSQTATRLGLDNTPPPAAVDRLRRLAVEVLEPLRAALGAPVVVTSGYRSPELCEAIGSSRTSTHTLGLAADIDVPGHPPTRVARELVTLGGYGRVILEFPPDGWVHVEAVDEHTAHRAGPLLLAERVDGRTGYRVVPHFG